MHPGDIRVLNHLPGDIYVFFHGHAFLLVPLCGFVGNNIRFTRTCNIVECFFSERFSLIHLERKPVLTQGAFCGVVSPCEPDSTSAQGQKRCAGAFTCCGLAKGHCLTHNITFICNISALGLHQANSLYHLLVPEGFIYRHLLDLMYAV